MASTAALDLRAREYTECPFPTYARLRDASPVGYSEQLQCWVVSTYELCRGVLKQPEKFRQWDGNEMHAPDNGPPYGNPRNWNPKVREVMKDAVLPVSTLVTANPPRHSRFRKLATSLFSARRTAERMEDEIQRIIDNAIDGFPEREVEFVSQFAIPVPMQVISRVLDVPGEMYATFATWADASIMTNAGRVVSSDEMAVHAQRIVEFQEYFLARLDERRDKAGEDVVSFLANAKIDDGDGGERPLTTAELLGLLLHFVTAGSETTTNLLGSIIDHVLTEPGLADRLRADPSAIPGVVEETLRCDGPVQGLFRWTTEDVELGGVSIPAGEKVLMLLGSANRDEARFQDAEEFRPDRDDARRHVAFGFGIHFCLGAPLARKESQMAVETLLRRLPGLRIAADAGRAEHHHQTLFRGFSELHVAYDQRD